MIGKKKYPVSQTRATDDIDRSIGVRLRFWRRTLNIDAKTLARKLQITYQQLQKYEKGVNRISASRLFRIAQVLRIPIENFYQDLDLIAQSTPPPTTKDILRSHIGLVEFMSTDVAINLCKGFIAIDNPYVKETVLRLVTSLAADSENRNAAVEEKKVRR